MKSSQIMGKSAHFEETRLLKETVILVSTTFVETDSYGFKELVHKLTGVSDDLEGEKLPVTTTSPPRDSRKPSSGSSHGCLKVVPQKFKHQRRKAHKRSETHLGLAHMPSFDLLPTAPSHTCSSNDLPPTAPPHTCSSTSHCCNHSSCSHSTPPSVTQDSYLEEEEQGYCFQPYPVSEKREPKLLPLFPLFSMDV